MVEQEDSETTSLESISPNLDSISPRLIHPGINLVHSGIITPPGTTRTNSLVDLSPASQSSLTPNRFKCLWLGCPEPVFLTEEALYEHVVQHHVATGKQICMWQIQGSPTRKSKGHKKSKPSCNTNAPVGPLGVACNTFTRSKGHFYDHIIVHFSHSLRPISCLYCDVRVRNRQELKRHVMANHSTTTVLPSTSTPSAYCFSTPSVNLLPTATTTTLPLQCTTTTTSGTTTATTTLSPSYTHPISQVYPFDAFTVSTCPSSPHNWVDVDPLSQTDSFMDFIKTTTSQDQDIESPTERDLILTSSFAISKSYLLNDLPMYPLIRDPTPVGIGFNVLYLSGFMQLFTFQTGIKFPSKWNRMVCQAYLGGGRVAPTSIKDLVNWIVFRNSSDSSPESNARQDQLSRIINDCAAKLTCMTIQEDGQIMRKCMAHVRQRFLLESKLRQSFDRNIEDHMSRLERMEQGILDSLSPPSSDKSPSPCPTLSVYPQLTTPQDIGMLSSNPLRELCMALLKKCWILLLRLQNEDFADLIELSSPDSPFTASPTSCLMGLKITIRYQTDLYPLIGRKAAYRSYFNVLGEKLNEIVNQEEEWQSKDPVWKALHSMLQVSSMEQEELGNRLYISTGASICPMEGSHPWILLWMKLTLLNNEDVGLDRQLFTILKSHEIPPCSSEITVIKPRLD